MARYNPIQNSFTSGLLSDRLIGRDDLDQYHAGMRQALNGIVLPHGGFQRRSGSYFVAEIKDSDKTATLIPFDVSVDQQYIMEFGDLYARFYANQGRIEPVPPTPLEIVTIYSEDETADLRWAQSLDVMWLVHENHHPYKLRRTAFDNFTLEKVVWRDGKAPLRPRTNPGVIVSAIVLTSGPVGVGGNYNITWDANIGLNASDDIGRAVRYNTSWYEITSVLNGYTVQATAMFIAAGSGDTADWALGLFSDTEGCRAVTFHEGRLWFGGARQQPDWVVASVSDDYDNFDRGSGETAEDADRSLAKPVVSTRLNAVQWMRSQGLQMAIGTGGAEFRAFGADNDILTPTSFVIRQATARGSAFVDPVTIDGQVLFAHNSRRTMYEFKYQLQEDSYRSRNLSILANDIFDDDEHAATGGGIRRMVYQQQSDSVIWCVRDDGKLVGFTYEPDQKVIGAHLHEFGADGEAQVEDAAVIQNPEGTADQLWLIVRRRVGTTWKRYVEFLVDPFRPVLTRRSTLTERRRALDHAYFVDCGLTLDEPVAITLATQENPVRITAPGHTFMDGDAVKIRRIGGMIELENLSATVTAVAGDTFQLVGVDGTEFAAYTSGGLVYEEVTAVAGLDHLETEEVTVLADGAPHPTRTVSSGTITLSRPASIVHIGLRQRFYGETQRFTGGGKLGSDQGQMTNVKRVAAILHNTMGGGLGVWKPETDPAAGPVLEDLGYRLGQDALDNPSPIFTGTTEVPVEGGWSIDSTVYFENDQPYPMTVLALAPRNEANER